MSDAAWAAIKPQLPKNQPGARRVDDRRVISGIVHMLKCGGRWADCPSEYGPSTTLRRRGAVRLPGADLLGDWLKAQMLDDD